MQENSTKSIHRLQVFITEKGISLNKLSVELGLSNSYFSKMVRNSGSIGSDIIEKIVRLYPDLNTEWLLTGNGCMLKKDVTCTLSEQNNEDKGCTPFLSPQCTQAGEMARNNSDIGHSSEEKGTDENVVYERIQKRHSEMKEYWQSEDYISENDRQSISEDYFAGGMSGKKDVRNLYQLTIRELSNKIAILKRDHKYSYNAYYKLFEAINNFKLGSYAERFEMPASWDEHINRFEKDMGDEYSGVEDKKLKAVFYVLGYEDEVEDIRSSIEVAISKFKDASHYISRIQSMSEFGKKDDHN